MENKKTHFCLFVKFLRYLLPYRKKQAAILILSASASVFGLLNPYLSKLAVDRALLNKEPRALIFLGAIGTLVFILSGLLRVAANILEKGLLLKVQFDINKQIFGYLQGLPFEFFQDKSTGEHMYKMHYDIERASEAIVAVPKDVANLFPRLFFTLIIIAYLDWQMAVFALCFIPALYLPLYCLTRKRRTVLESLFANTQNIFKQLQEFFSHIYLIKAFGKENEALRMYSKALIASTRIRLKSMRLEILGSFADGSLNRLAVGLVALFGGYRVITDKISIGTLTAIMIYLAQLVSLQGNFVYFGQRIIFGLISCRRLDEILQQKQRSLRNFKKQKIVFSPQSRIEFKEVCFGYRSGEHILNNISFEMTQGCVALVGASGCGKTTIVNLVLGLYEPWSGNIFINGHSVEVMDSSLLQKQVGVALQESYLWNDTIENNIKYAKTNATQEEIHSVAKVTGVDDIVRSLPLGYATIIGENACKLSEGQKQKIALARALLKKPKILILDEAMASMDSLSEERIVREIKQLPISLVIIVSHRLSSVMACERVYFFESPTTVITAQPEDLLTTNKTFSNLFATQLHEPF